MIIKDESSYVNAQEKERILTNKRNHLLDTDCLSYEKYKGSLCDLEIAESGKRRREIILERRFCLSTVDKEKRDVTIDESREELIENDGEGDDIKIISKKKAQSIKNFLYLYFSDDNAYLEVY